METGSLSEHKKGANSRYVCAHMFVNVESGEKSGMRQQNYRLCSN